MVKCPDCGAGADLTKDGEWAHCASCNNIFQPDDAKSKGGDGKADGSGKEGQTKQGEDTGEGEGGK